MRNRTFSGIGRRAWGRIMVNRRQERREVVRGEGEVLGGGKKPRKGKEEGGGKQGKGGGKQRRGGGKQGRGGGKQEGEEVGEEGERRERVRKGGGEKRSEEGLGNSRQGHVVARGEGSLDRHARCAARSRAPLVTRGQFPPAWLALKAFISLFTHYLSW